MPHFWFNTLTGTTPRTRPREQLNPLTAVLPTIWNLQWKPKFRKASSGSVRLMSKFFRMWPLKILIIAKKRIFLEDFSTRTRWICRLVKCSRRSGIFPECWKSAIVVLLPKRDKFPTYLENLRSISLLNTMAKLVETFLKSNIEGTVEDLKLWEPGIYAFSIRFLRDSRSWKSGGRSAPFFSKPKVHEFTT